MRICPSRISGIKLSSFTNNNKALSFAYIWKHLSVKTLQQSLYPYISNLAIALCFLPFILLWWRKISKEKSFLFVGIYWLANGLLNLPNWIGQANNSSLQSEVTLCYNLLDAPLAILVFYSASQGMKRKILLYLMIGFILFEMVVIKWKGHNFDSSTVIIGGSTLIALLFSLWGIAEYFNKIEHTYFEHAMGFIYAGFLFNYGPFILIYIYSYLNKSTGTTTEANFFLYYLSLLSATLLTTVGIWRYGRPALLPLRAPA